MEGRLSGCKEPVKPLELINGLGKGRSRVRGDLGGRGGGREAEVEAEAGGEVCGRRAGGSRWGEAGEWDKGGREGG